MVRPIGRPLARRPPSVEDLCGEFLIHSEARNLSGRTLEWYEDRAHRFAEFTQFPTQTCPRSGSMGYGLAAAIAA